MSEEDKTSKEDVTLKSTKEVVVKGELTGIDLLGSDKGDREVLVPKRAEQDEDGRDLERPGMVKCNKVQGSCIACHTQGEMRCAKCEDVYCSDGCYERDWDLHRKSCRPPLPNEKTGKDA